MVEVNNLTVDNAKTSNGFVNISTGNSSTLTVTSINAATGTSGNVTLSGGNLAVGVPGIMATNTVNLSGITGTITVNAGGTIVAPTTILNTNSPSNTVNWVVNTQNATGSGSLYQVLTNVNQFNNSSTITIANGSNFIVTLTTALPAITKQLTLNGNNNLTIVGTNVGSASGLVLAGNGINISGVALRNFSGGGAGIALTGTRNSTVSNVTVSNSSVGILASGALDGTVVKGSSFLYDGQGAVLSGATGFQFGVSSAANSFNTISNSTTYGMSITGTCGGTKIFGNQFLYNPTAISLAAATGSSPTSLLLIGQYSATPATNTTRNTITGGSLGVLATGFCTYAQINQLIFANPAVTTQYNVVNSRNLTITR